MWPVCGWTIQIICLVSWRLRYMKTNPCPRWSPLITLGFFLFIFAQLTNGHISNTKHDFSCISKMIFSKHLVNYGCEISQFQLNLCPWCNYHLSFGLSCYLHSSFYSQEKKKNSVLWTRCNDNNNIILTFLSLFMNCIAQNRGNA